MKYFGNNHITRAIFTALALGVLSVGIISLTTMSHESSIMSANCPLTMDGGDCSQPGENDMCISYHLGIIQNLSSALPQSFGMEVFGFWLAALYAFAIFGLLDRAYLYFCRLKIRLKHLFEETIEAFHTQLGSWLALIQKKDPSYAFSLA